MVGCYAAVRFCRRRMPRFLLIVIILTIQPDGT
jgi:hypothetical protein